LNQMSKIDQLIESADASIKAGYTTAEEANAELQNRLDDIAVLMDDDIRERIHSELAPCTARAFLKAYDWAHSEKHGEDFDW
jgi:hypothetical protein